MGSVASNLSALRSDKERTRLHLFQDLSEAPLFTWIIIIGYAVNKFPRHQRRLLFTGRFVIGSTDFAALGPYCHDLGPIFPSTARASEVSKLFIIWHCFFHKMWSGSDAEKSVHIKSRLSCLCLHFSVG